MKDSKIVFCDTSFFLRLLNEEDSLHSNAYGYYKYFLEEGYALCVSTIAIAEFCVRNEFESLPLMSLRVSPFNVDHAKFAGVCAKTLFDARVAGVIDVNPRVIITNDVKLLAQAQWEGAGYYITSDKECKKMYDVLVNDKKVSFKFVDIMMPHTSIFGLLDL